MKFYYVALTINNEHPVKTDGGKRLAYYLKKQQAVQQCAILNKSWQAREDNWELKGESYPKFIFKVYCVESEPKEIE